MVKKNYTRDDGKLIYIPRVPQVFKTVEEETCTIELPRLLSFFHFSEKRAVLSTSIDHFHTVQSKLDQIVQINIEKRERFYRPRFGTLRKYTTLDEKQEKLQLFGKFTPSVFQFFIELNYICPILRHLHKSLKVGRQV